MKKLIALLLMLCLLTGCANTADNTKGKGDKKDADSQSETNTVETPKENYDSTPAIKQNTIMVQGKTVSVYEQDTEYVNFTEVLNILGGTFTEQGTKQPFDTTFTVFGHTFSFNNASTELGEGETMHPLVHRPLYDGKSWYMPLAPIMSLLSLQNFTDEKSGNSYYTYVPYNDSVAEGIKIPTLMYHAVAETPWSSISELFVRPSELEKQLQYLKDNGYTTITFEDFGNLENIEKPVMLTFDDGYDDNYTELFPLLQKYNAKATVFVITSLIATEHYLTEEQIKEMSDSGLVSIQSHTVSHSFLSDLNEDELIDEMTASKAVLTKITGKEPFVLCYPTGKYSNLSLTVTRDHFQYGLLMNGGMYTTGQNSAYMIPRFYISRATGIDSFADKLN